MERGKSECWDMAEFCGGWDGGTGAGEGGEGCCCAGEVDALGGRGREERKSEGGVGGGLGVWLVLVYECDIIL